MSKKTPNPRKVRQFEKNIKNFIRENGGSNMMFRNFKNKPTEKQIIDMYMAGKFGIGHPFDTPNIEFCLEYAFDEFNEVFSLIEEQDDWENQSNGTGDWNIFFRAQDETWANIVFSIHVDSSFAPFVTKLDRSEFTHFTDRNEELIHEQTRAIVFDFKFMGKLTKSDPLYLHNADQINFSEMETKDKCMFHYGIWIASADRYDEFSDSKELELRKSLRSEKIPSDGTSNYIVYTAKDNEGILRYIGEGKSERYLHINSGASHNFKVNEHYFSKGEMTVDIVRGGLTKLRALAIEKFLISRHSNSLWNIRDNPNVIKPNKSLKQDK